MDFNAILQNQGVTTTGGASGDFKSLADNNFQSSSPKQSFWQKLFQKKVSTESTSPNKIGAGDSNISGAVDSLKTEFGGSSQGVANKLKTDIQQGAQDIQKGAEKGLRASSLFNKGSIKPKDQTSGAQDIAKGVLKTGARVAGDTAEAVFAPISAAVESTGVGSLFNKAGEASQTKGGILDKVTSMPEVQKFATDHPNAGEDFNRLLNLIFASGESGKVEPSSIASDASTAVKNTADTISNLPTDISQTKTELKTALKDKYVASEKNAWTKPVEKTAPAYNKATDIYNAAKAKGTDIGQVLLDNKIKLSDNVETQGTGRQVYSTADTADKVRSDAQKITTDLLRPALREADLSQPPVPSSTFIEQAINNIEGDKSILTETKDKIVSAIKKIKFDATYTLEKLLDEKIARDLNSKYSPVGDIATNIEAIKNNAIADALRTTLKANVPDSIPIDAVNAEATKLYQTANYLASLDTKPVPKSLASSLRGTAAKVIGAAVGETVGGGLLGGVGGYHLAGLLERAFENMPDPIKRSVLSSLKVEQPEVFDSLKKYLGKEETARLTRKALPAGDTSKQAIPLNQYFSPDVNKVQVIQGKNVVPERLQLPAPQSINLGGDLKDGSLVDADGNKIIKPTQAQILEAKKYGITRDPKTGRFQKAYMSSSS